MPETPNPMSTVAADIQQLSTSLGMLAVFLNSKSSSLEKKEKAADPAIEAPTITLEQVRAILADKSRAGFTAEIHALLQKYGADRLSQLDPANYKALLADVEVLKDAT